MPIPPEEAKKYLDSCRFEGWKQERDRRAILLLPDVGTAYRQYIDYGLGWDQTQKRLNLAHTLESLSVKGRKAFFDLIAPGMADWMELAWTRAAKDPYMTSYGRRPFRSPTRPESVRSARVNLIIALEWFFQDRRERLPWFAIWAPYMETWRGLELGRILGWAIDQGGAEGEEILATLKAIVEGTHREGAMGIHVISALLTANRLEAWQLAEDLLLKAERQEGLRQTILETVDMANPQAFIRMLRLIVEHNLGRFSSVWRAVLVWGLPVTENAKDFNRVIGRVLELLQDREERARVVREGDPLDLKLALWTAAYFDVIEALALADQAYRRPDIDVRFNTIVMVGMFSYRPSIPILHRAIHDPEVKVAARALAALDQFRREQLENTIPRKEIEALADRLPAKMPDGLPARQEALNFLLEITEDKDLPLILDRVSEMSAGHRETFLRRCRDGKVGGIRTTMFQFIGDASPSVRKMAFDYIRETRLKPEEAPQIEQVLGRKASDLRVAAMQLLSTQPRASIVKSASRLMESSEEPRRIAGLELLADLHQGGHEQRHVENSFEEFRKRHANLTENERTQIERVMKSADSDSLLLKTAFGLADFQTLPTPEKPRAIAENFSTPASMACIHALDELVHQNRDVKFRFTGLYGYAEEDMILGESSRRLPLPKVGVPMEQQAEALPAREAWFRWLDERGADTRDSDGLELVRALGTMISLDDLYKWENWGEKRKLGTVADGIEKVIRVKKLGPVRYPSQIAIILQWLVAASQPDGATVALDAWQTVIANCYEKKYKYDDDRYYSTEVSWRTYDGLKGWLTAANFLRTHVSGSWKAEHDVRLYKLLKFYDEPEFKGRNMPGETIRGAKRTILGLKLPTGKSAEVPERMPPEVEDLIRALNAGAVSEVEVIDYLLLSDSHRHTYRNRGPLVEATQRKQRLKCPDSSELDRILQRLIDRLVQVSITRGDLPTEACPFSENIRSGLSLRHLAPVMAAAKGINWDRSYYSDSHSKSVTFSNLVRHSKPLLEDTPERFKALLGKQSEKSLVEMAMFAPQWAKHVEHTIGWPGLEEAVWWMHAHTKDDQWGVDEDLKEAWKNQISERTPLDSESLMNGAVDTKWFLGIRAHFDEKRWKVIDSAAKFASGGVGHKRAQKFADAMLGRVTLADLEKVIADKRHQDSVRAIGLVPITGEADILSRYQLLQKFLKESRQFGSMKQASEKLAVSIALENLARTAGYPDPIRLQWAMEAREIEDLKSGSMSASAGEIIATLTILPTGDPEITAEKSGKPIKEVPAAVKKHAEIKHLFNRRKEVQAQARRMRWSLESAMIRGDEFTASELVSLIEHPVLAPMLRTLVFITDGGEFGWLDQGRLIGLHGKEISFSSARLGHAFDLLDSAKWADWQREVFAREVVQPFKQVFRELYVPTENELKAETRSQRYTGHQLNPRQALGILGKRGWVIGGEEGVRKVMHEHRLVAHIWFEETFYTPADIEGLTLDSLSFTKTGDWNQLKLADIPPRVFSETMRDLDLIVSVAHMGGFDPETSQSSIEMRASVVRETARLVGLSNVAIDSPRAVVQGELGEYAIHLGSGNIHRRPGGEIVVVPVHSQHRGRMFLPFIDDDPKTAEIVSKVLLFAEDSKIQDPNIVRQILS